VAEVFAKIQDLFYWWECILIGFLE